MRGKQRHKEEIDEGYAEEFVGEGWLCCLRKKNTRLITQQMNDLPPRHSQF